MKTKWLSGIAVLPFMLPAAACGQVRQQPARGPANVASAGSGMSLQAFTARRERRMLAADTDGDGRVSRAEFVASAASGRGDPARRFGRLDRDGNGAVDRSEIAAAAERRFRRLDADGDGLLQHAERRAGRSGAAAGAPDR